MRDWFDTRPYRLSVTALFALWLCAPGVGALLGVGTELVSIEGRAASPMPTLPRSCEEFTKLPMKLEAFGDDGFGFRSQLLTAHSLIHLAMGMSGSPDYVLGKNGWFFHRSVDRQLDQARGMEVFTEHELDLWIRTMEQRQRWLEQRGIDFLLLIAPSKHSIYPENLPAWAYSVGPTRHEQLIDRLETLPSSLRLVPLRAALLEAKRKHQIYRTTDDHWNDLGAYVAYEQIARQIALRHPNVPVLSMNELELTTNRQAIGTITRGLNLTRFVREDVPSLGLPQPGNVIEWLKLGEGPIYDPQHIAVWRTEFTDRPTVLFFRDSFSQPVAGMLSGSIHRTVLAHHQNGGFRRGLVERFRPDLVVYEMIERGLRWPLHDP